MSKPFDVLVVGSGPAGSAAAAALNQAGLRVGILSPAGPDAAWPNTYGVWADELTPLGLDHVLGHRWQKTVVYFNNRQIPLGREYGLFDNAALQAHLLGQMEGVTWQRGLAGSVSHEGSHSTVITQAGERLTARLVIDASGHAGGWVQRPPSAGVAIQAAYGIVGTFTRPPVEPEQLALMDYRPDFLTPAERTTEPPTFLYAMDLGQGVYFVEETSLAHVPGVPLDALEARLHRRLAHHGVAVEEVHHVERCWFPMNTPLPVMPQPVVGFGGAASMVHPATGYQVGGALKLAPALAQSIARALGRPNATPADAVQAGWQAVWPPDRLRRYRLYLFGLQNVMRFNEAQLHDFFTTFFHLPRQQWSGYLSNTLSTSELMTTMLRIFGRAPFPVQRSLTTSIVPNRRLLWRTLQGR